MSGCMTLATFTGDLTSPGFGCPYPSCFEDSDLAFGVGRIKSCAHLFLHSGWSLVDIGVNSKGIGVEIVVKVRSSQPEPRQHEGTLLVYSGLSRGLIKSAAQGPRGHSVYARRKGRVFIQDGF